jgi:hypothetical protein
MQGGHRHRVSGALVCLAIAALWAGASRSAWAAGDYEIDIQGTLEILGPAGSSQSTPAPDEQDVSYQVIFQYQEPGAAAGPQGLSFLDRVAQVSEGKFEIKELRGNKVYRVTVERVVFSPSAPGGAVRELIPLDIPPDFFLQTPLPPGAAIPPTPVEVPLALGSAGKAETTARALSFLYNGQDVMMSARTEAPPVS